MDTVLLDRAYDALCATLGEEQTWAQIEPPARVWVPLKIQRLEERLTEAYERQDVAVEMHEQACTEATRETLGEINAEIAALQAELEVAREMWREHPEAFEDEEA